MKNSIIIPTIICSIFFSTVSSTAVNTTLIAPGTYLGINSSQLFPAESSSKIQVALLFDTSNSMDGLLEQAKSRLWDVVNTLTTLKYEGKTPSIEIALYEYGNQGLSSKTNYIRQVTALTTDLDLISEKLFALKTNGGDEFCGAVIQTSVKELKWDDAKSTMKLIYISGNESFDQGSVNYKTAISGALKSNIYVNTIYCGDKQEGVSLFWQDGAINGHGKYFNIDSDEKIEYIKTPYDDMINACNDKLNKTYIGYGKNGVLKKRTQEAQDYNAKSISLENNAARVVSKCNAAYCNSSWDLVDTYKDDTANIDKIKEEDLPVEFKNKSKEQIKVMVVEKVKERETVQKEIGELALKRQKYITEAAKTKTNNTKDDLGTAIKSSIIVFAKIKGYQVEE